MDDRVAREQAFHDARFGAERARAFDRFYSITESRRQAYDAPAGWALFSEPLGHNPLVNWYRNRTPEQRTEDEHPLLLSSILQRLPRCGHARCRS
jgi:hypothetical protein